MKPKCYIWDIDGTVAHRTGRSPYDYTLVSTDTPDKNIQQIFRAIKYGEEGAQMIFITGRDESCKSDTVDWLRQHGFAYSDLYMRPLGNKDLDTKIKLDIYNNYIKDKYEVIAVFEDRKRCVELYRNHLGLKVLQVADGNY